MNHFYKFMMLGITAMLFASPIYSQDEPSYGVDEDGLVCVDTATRGETITVESKLFNQGSSSLNPEVKMLVSYYLGKTNEIDADAIFVSSVQIDDIAGADDDGSLKVFVNVSSDIKIPETVSTGWYKLLIQVNGDSAHIDSSYHDNIKGRRVYVRADLPDYKILSMEFSGTLQAGESATLVVNVENIGQADPDAGTKQWLYIYMCTDTNFLVQGSYSEFTNIENDPHSVFVAQVQFGAINMADGETEVTVVFPIPQRFNLSTHVFAFTNIFPDMEEFEEMNKLNNYGYLLLGDDDIVGAETIYDISSEILSIGATTDYSDLYSLSNYQLMGNTTAEMTYHLQNFSGKAVNTGPGDFFTVEGYLSTDISLDATDLLVFSDTVTGSTFMNDKKMLRETEFLVPAAINSSDYYVILKSDAGNNIEEGGCEDNNVTVSYFKVNVLVSNAIEDAEESEKAFFILYPNPSYETLSIRYSLDEEAEVYLDIYNQSGILAYQDQIAGQQPGEYTEQLNLELPAGVYFVKLTVNGKSYTQKLLVY